MVKVLAVSLFLATELDLVIMLSSPQGEDTKSAECADFPPRGAAAAPGFNCNLFVCDQQVFGGGRVNPGALETTCWGNQRKKTHQEEETHRNTSEDVPLLPPLSPISPSVRSHSLKPLLIIS